MSDPRRTSSVAARLQGRLASQDGFTLVETLVAAILLVIGLFAVVGTLDHSRRLGDHAQAQGSAADFAERELESVLSQPYSQIALTALPATSNPQFTNWSSIRQNLPASPNNERTDANTVVCASPCTGAVQPIQDWTNDKFNSSTSTVRGKIYRYVTWVDDASASCGATGAGTTGNCPGTTDYKRVTIAIRVTDTSGAAVSQRQGPRVPIVVSAVKANPRVTVGNQNGRSSPCGLGGVTC